MRDPLYARRFRLGNFTRSFPSYFMDPWVTAPVPGSRSMMAWAVVDLPDPDSPTIATVWPSYMVRFIPCTARTWRLSTMKLMCRFSISKSGVSLTILFSRFRIQSIAYRITEQHEAQDGDC